MGAVGIYIIAIMSFSVAWAGTKAIQRNYQLMKQVSVLEQEAEIARQRVENQKLQNEYYASEAYLELAARRQLNRAAPGEKLMIIPKSIARSKVPQYVEKQSDTGRSLETLPNWQAWLQFLSGRGLE